MSEVVASLLVKFGEDVSSSALVVLELDEEKNGDKARFAPGDTIHFRLHHDSTVQLGKMAVTHGMVVDQGGEERTLTAQLLWTELGDEHELAYIPVDSLAVGFFGNEATGLKRAGQRKVVISGGNMPAVCKVEYAAAFSLFKLLAPDVELGVDEIYPVVIVAYMEGAA